MDRRWRGKREGPTAGALPGDLTGPTVVRSGGASRSEADAQGDRNALEFGEVTRAGQVHIASLESPLNTPIGEGNPHAEVDRVVTLNFFEINAVAVPLAQDSGSSEEVGRDTRLEREMVEGVHQ